MKPLIKKALNKILIFIFWIIVWQILHMIIQRDLYLPSPFKVFIALWELVFLRTFWKSIAYSMARVIAGVILSVLLGIFMAILCSINDYLYQLFQPLMITIKTTPVLSFIIIALIWFPSSKVPIFICFLMCFPIIWTNILTGIKNVDTKLIEMAKVYKVRKLTVFQKIYLPSLIPYFSAACITSLGLGWRASIAAEVLSHPRNAIGSQLYSAKVYLDSNELFAWTLVVILLSLLFESLFAYFIKRFTIKQPYYIKL